MSAKIFVRTFDSTLRTNKKTLFVDLECWRRIVVGKFAETTILIKKIDAIREVIGEGLWSESAILENKLVKIAFGFVDQSGGGNQQIMVARSVQQLKIKKW